MITFNDTIPIVLTGQYWANLMELSLMQVLEGYPGPHGYSFTQWCPGQETESQFCIIPPLRKEFRLLRWSYPYSDELISNDLGYKFKSRTGDILELNSGLLAFVVVGVESVTLHTDERIPLPIDYIEPSVYSVIQRGPGPLENITPPNCVRKPILNRYERIRNANNSDISMVRPMGGFILRSEEENPLLLSRTHTRSEGGVFTNINLSSRWRHL